MALITEIPGLRIVANKKSEDNRGESCQLFSEELLASYKPKEVFVSKSYKNVIRGMHFQPEPYGQKKLISVIEGSIKGVVLDLRRESPSFLKFQEVCLTESCGYSLLVPPYCAWGFQTLQNKNTVVYCISGIYKKGYDLGVRWNTIDYSWGLQNPIMSERDRNLMSLEEYLKNV